MQVTCMGQRCHRKQNENEVGYRNTDYIRVSGKVYFQITASFSLSLDRETYTQAPKLFSHFELIVANTQKIKRKYNEESWKYPPLDRFIELIWKSIRDNGFYLESVHNCPKIFTNKLNKLTVIHAFLCQPHLHAMFSTKWKRG